MSDLPQPDALEGAPHPRETARLFGQDRAAAQFIAALQAGRLHSGWILSGPRGIGKATLAYRIASVLLDPPAGGDGTLDPDQSGAGWRQIQAEAHPRLFVLKRGPNQTGSALSQVISVDRVRALKEFFHLSAADGGHRVVIVDAADEMNTNAANALLKELEEPPARSTMLLLSHQPSRLLPTIRSRCRMLRLDPLAPEDLGAALAQAGIKEAVDARLATLAGGSVGRAITLLHNDGPALYGDILALFATARMDRPGASALADSLSARGAEARFRLATTLIATLCARAARSGLIGPPQPEAAAGEAQILARIAPHDRAARAWAEAATDLPARLNQGFALNIDRGGLMLDALLRLEPLARGA